jgi:TolA-binding protein
MKNIILTLFILILLAISGCRDRNDVEALYRETASLEARIYDCAEDIARYREKCEAILKVYPRSEYADDALYKLGMLNEIFGHYTEAVAYYEKLWTHYPEHQLSASALYHSAMIHLDHLEDDTKAAGLYLKVARCYSSNALAAEAILSLGHIASRGEQWTDAVGYYSELLEKCPEHPSCDALRFRTAEIYHYQLNQPDAARAMYETLIDTQPRSDWASQAKLQLLQISEGGEADE